MQQAHVRCDAFRLVRHGCSRQMCLGLCSALSDNTNVHVRNTLGGLLTLTILSGNREVRACRAPMQTSRHLKGAAFIKLT